MSRHIGKLHWWTHAQDLKREEGGRGLNGRAWLHLYWGDPDQRGRSLTVLGIQWVLARRQHSVGWSFSAGGGDGDRDIDFSIRIPWFGIYLSADDLLPRKWEFYNPGQKYPSERQIGVTWHDQALWVDLWRDPSESWGHGGPSFWKDARSRNRSIAIHPLDLLFGKQHYSKRELSTERVDVPMPEGTYPASVVLFESTWKRPRWPIARRLIRAEITPDTPIGEPGKGENGWDCEDDAAYSLTTVASSAAEAAQALCESVMRTRTQRAGADWVPAQGQP